MTIILSVALLLSITLLIAAIMIAKAQYTRAETYETMLVENNEALAELQNDVTQTYLRLKFIDNKQMFEKDDEVGAVFQDIVDLIAKLNSRAQQNLS